MRSGNGRLGRPRDGDSAATERRILGVARTRFARQGFSATTNRQIAHDAGITAAALYHYVPSKAALYAAVYNDTLDQVYTEFEQAAAGPTRLIDQYLAVLTCAHDLQRSDPAISGLIVAVARETRRHPDLLELVQPQRGRHARFFRELVDAAVARGELAGDVDPAALADLLGALLIGLARMSAGADDLSRYADALDVLRRFLSGSLLQTS